MSATEPHKYDFPLFAQSYVWFRRSSRRVWLFTTPLAQGWPAPPGAYSSPLTQLTRASAACQPTRQQLTYIPSSPAPTPPCPRTRRAARRYAWRRRPTDTSGLPPRQQAMGMFSGKSQTPHDSPFLPDSATFGGKPTPHLGETRPLSSGDTRRS